MCLVFRGGAKKQPSAMAQWHWLDGRPWKCTWLVCPNYLGSRIVYLWKLYTTFIQVILSSLLDVANKSNVTRANSSQSWMDLGQGRKLQSIALTISIREYQWDPKSRKRGESIFLLLHMKIIQSWIHQEYYKIWTITIIPT